MGVLPINETVLSHGITPVPPLALIVLRVYVCSLKRKSSIGSVIILILEKENITEEYFGINPKGLCPSSMMVVVVESSDILLS